MNLRLMLILIGSLLTSLPVNAQLTETDFESLSDSIYRMRPPDLRGVVLYQGGERVWELYANSWMDENILDIRSAGKSITGLLALIAVDKGLIGLEDPVGKYFPQYQPFDNFDPRKGRIRIIDLLNMASGLAADAYDNNSPGNEGFMAESDDYVKFVLDLPMAFNPGKKYVYNSASAMLIGAIVEVAADMTLAEFADAHLFGRLGIEAYFWQTSPKGRTTGMGNLYLAPGDLAKIGLLIQQKGTWEGQQLIDESLIQTLLSAPLEADNDPFADHYGCFWYRATDTIEGRAITYHYASGNGGNKLYIVPELELVMAIGQTAYGYGYGHRRAAYILGEVIRIALE